MPKISIDGRPVEVPEGSSILDAAEKLGVRIPTLCHEPGFEHGTSCMVCVVRVAGLERLVPACATPAHEGMAVETNSEEVRDARRIALELLLSDHVGDCEGPCTNACPASMNIPAMLRHLQSGEWEKAHAIAANSLVIPEILGAICPSPCEKACRRRLHDGAVAIKNLHRLIAARFRKQGCVAPSAVAGAAGRKVAVVGAGPAGLSAAFNLAKMGHHCSIHDKHGLPGGMLRYGVPDSVLPPQILEQEIKSVLSTGIGFIPSYDLKNGEDIMRLRESHDAVVLALGNDADIHALGLAGKDGGLLSDRGSNATSIDGVFAAGGMISPIRRMAVRAIASGRHTAECVDHYLRGGGQTSTRHRINVKMGALNDEEMGLFLKSANPGGRLLDDKSVEAASEEKCIREAARCLDCDCIAAEDCKLRSLSAEYSAIPTLFKERRRPFKQDASHPEIVFEQGKCIACGLCIQVSERAGETHGNTFIGRGFDVRVTPPSGFSMEQALKKSARECVEICPTGALRFKRRPTKN